MLKTRESFTSALEKNCSGKFHRNDRKTFLMEHFPKKLQAATLLIKYSIPSFFLWILRNCSEHFFVNVSSLFRLFQSSYSTSQTSFITVAFAEANLVREGKWRGGSIFCNFQLLNLLQAVLVIISLACSKSRVSPLKDISKKRSQSFKL